MQPDCRLTYELINSCRVEDGRGGGRLPVDSGCAFAQPPQAGWP
jgi:hypothetical protein